MGRTCGVLMQRLGFADVDLAVCALLGSAAFVAGVLRRTVSLGVVLIEVTSAVSIVPSLMMAMLVAKCIGDRVNPSLVDEQTRIKEIPYLAPRPAAVTRGLSMRAADVMSTRVVVVREVERVGRVLEVLRSCAHSAFPVVSARGACEGILTRKSLAAALQRPEGFLAEAPAGGGPKKFGPSAPVRRVAVAGSLRSGEGGIRVRASDEGRFVDLREYMLPNPCVEQDTPLEMTHDLFRSLGLSHLPVVRECADVVGIGTARDPGAAVGPRARRRR